ncbi:UbiA prenyltransferase family-domain-containing protein [Mycena polygramma]|nr:UbiA prenyltransferase family-domain-containing protein [Mycena polygramma]
MLRAAFCEPAKITMSPSSALLYLTGLGRATCYNVFTLYLFTQTDIKTTLIPISVFALGCAPICELRSTTNTLQTVLWIWLQLLHFNLANQTSVTSIKEDCKNKPFRPLPSRRITLQQARILRYVCFVGVLSLSATFGLAVFLCNVGYTILIVSYHDFHGDSHWLSKSTVCAFGYGFSEAGATLVAGCDRHHIGGLARISIILSVAIIATTIHAQDFQDCEGDRLAGRQTLPIAFPVLSRYLTSFGIIGWSLVLSRVWSLDFVARAAVILLGMIAGVRYMVLRSVRDDEHSYILYNVWLLVTILLPVYSQLPGHFSDGVR